MSNDNQTPRHIQIGSVPADVSAAITLLLDSPAEIAKTAKADEPFKALVSDATRAAVTVIDGLRDLAADAKRAHDEGDWG